MKIDRSQVKGPAESHRPGEATSQQRPAAADQNRSPHADQVTLSSRAQEVNALQSRLRQEPAVRAELVERIKAQIAAGTYRTEVRSLVDSLMDTRVLD